MENKILKLRPAGMFSNVNEVVQHIHLANQGRYRFIINWQNSCYRCDSRTENPWNYYFLPIWPDLKTEETDLEVLPTGGKVACTKDNIITPRKIDGQCTSLLLPPDRNLPGQLINEHIVLNEDTDSKVTSFIQDNLTQPYIGLHIRGPGRTHGSAAKLRKKYWTIGGVPYSAYFDAVDQALLEMPDAKVFACSDSSVVIQKVKRKYGDRVVVYDATRSKFGEMHANHKKNKGQVFDTYKLGLDVLVEAYILSNCALFIHGNTNVANFVLCKSPELKHIYVSA